MPPKPGPPMPTPYRLISFADARQEVSHRGCIHLTTAADEPKVQNGNLVSAFAAEAGDISALRFLRTRGVPWDFLTPAKAAERGHLAVLKYVHSCGCAWDGLTPAAAAYGGFLDCLLYCLEHECPMDARVTAWAVAAGHGEIYRWAKGAELPISAATERRAQAQFVF